jgi:HAD superfamily hydrolase (TIGR01509 family)
VGAPVATSRQGAVFGSRPERQTGGMIDAVIFDLDGVLVDSEQVWDEARRGLVEQSGGHWEPGATEAVLGMSSTEWSAYLHDRLAVPLSAPEINAEVVRRVLAAYRVHLPLLPGATEAVRRMAGRWPLGLASSSNRTVIDAVLEEAGLSGQFGATVSSEEVGRGKPAPDVYLEAARRLGADAPACAVIEDSANGIRSGLAAGMTVVAIPNPHFPPPAEVLALVSVVLPDIADLVPEVLA